MNRGSTLFLRAAVLVMALAVLTLWILSIPVMHREWAIEYPDFAYLRYPAMVGIGVTAIAFFTALYHVWKLLSYIDKNNVFSEPSVKALKNIKYCGFIIGAVYVAGMPFAYFTADEDDAPGLIIVGLVFAFAPIVVAVFANIFQRLLQNVIDIKSENDLTV